MADIQEVVDVWEEYLRGIDNWEALVAGVEPTSGGCGMVYGLPNPIDRPGENYAIADMRHLQMSEAHYHPDPDIEIYFVLQGFGKIAVGGDIYDLTPLGHVVIPPDKVHITRPGQDLVLAVVNTPPFSPNRYIVVDENEPAVAEMIHTLSA